MKTPLYVAGRFKIFDAQNKLVAVLEPTHRIEAEALARAYNAHDALVAALDHARIALAAATKGRADLIVPHDEALAKVEAALALGDERTAT